MNAVIYGGGHMPPSAKILAFFAALAARIDAISSSLRLGPGFLPRRFSHLPALPFGKFVNT